MRLPTADKAAHMHGLSHGPVTKRSVCMLAQWCAQILRPAEVCAKTSLDLHVGMAVGTLPLSPGHIYELSTVTWSCVS